MDNPDFGGNWYVRDLPYGFDTLVENLAGKARRSRQGYDAVPAACILRRLMVIPPQNSRRFSISAQGQHIILSTVADLHVSLWSSFS